MRYCEENTRVYFLQRVIKGEDDLLRKELPGEPNVHTVLVDQILGCCDLMALCHLGGISNLVL